MSDAVAVSGETPHFRFRASRTLYERARKAADARGLTIADFARNALDQAIGDAAQPVTHHYHGGNDLLSVLDTPEGRARVVATLKTAVQRGEVVLSRD